MSPELGAIVAKNMVVAIHYTLKDDAGTVIDSSSQGAPLEYLHGAGNIVPGLESKLSGRARGESLKVAVAPADGYGEHDPRGVQRVPRDAFPAEVDIAPGMQFSAEDPNGEPHTVWIREVDGDHVVIDMNHPLAGKTLHFDVTIASLRAATKDEISHGHPHGPGGHHHH